MLSDIFYSYYSCHCNTSVIKPRNAGSENNLKTQFFSLHLYKSNPQHLPRSIMEPETVLDFSAAISSF